MNDDPQPRRAAELIKALNSRRIGLGALGCWVLAVAILILHAIGNQLGIPSTLYFATAETWMIGFGSVGTPVFALRALGRHLTATACLLGCMLLTGGALAYTGFLPSMHPSPFTAAFVLIPILAAAIDCANAASALTREGAAERRGYGRAAQEIEAIQTANDTLSRQVVDLAAALTEARAEADAAFGNGVRAGIQACAVEIRERDDALGALDEMPLAEVRRLRRAAERALPAAVSGSPPHIVPSRENHPDYGRANGHAPGLKGSH